MYCIIAIFMIIMLFISAVWNMLVFSVLVSNKQLTQIIKISFIKTEQIHAKTLAEMKQNEMNLMLQDLWGSAKSISDMVTRPDEILVKGYDGASLVDNAHEAYVNTEEDSPEREAKNADWNRGTWYTCADQECSDTLEQNFPNVKKDIGICGTTFAFRGEAAVNPRYVKELLPGSYIGMADSAVFCMKPKFYN